MSNTIGKYVFNKQKGKIHMFTCFDQDMSCITEVYMKLKRFLNK